MFPKLFWRGDLISFSLLLQVVRTLERLVTGLGSAGQSRWKDVYKLVARTALLDRSLPVRSAAARVCWYLDTTSAVHLRIKHNSSPTFSALYCEARALYNCAT